ncbi:NUDIX domain-containing protein [Loktanella sp. DJP18]|uniref:NUDIX domain-containing protein n=1 Tax=Loktanella sp. DJP18 TaxID=3409788 RepID=UPI003BB6C7BB
MDVFVYGILCDADLRRAVAGDAGHVTPVTLHGHAVRPVVDDVVPTITTRAGATAAGLLWRGLTADQVDRVALFAAAFGATPTTVTVTWGDTSTAMARMWLLRDVAVPGPGNWSFAAWQAGCAATTVDATQELFASMPRPDPANLRRQWPMMLKRAWARHCAEIDGRPASLRHKARAEDTRVSDRTAPAGRFFRLQGFDVTHHRFDGGTQGPLPREVFVGIDAVLVLPYDPVRGRIVLVEQVRMGALERGDPNPWVLEPVAGMIDAFQTPEDAALRETREEAGLDVRLRHVASYYPSPGNATDYFHTYVGLCDLPDLERYSGGLDSEQEDLRLHVLSLDAALALVESGEIAAGPGIALIYWLALHRDALRLEFAPAGA